MDMKEKDNLHTQFHILKITLRLSQATFFEDTSLKNDIYLL